MTEDSLYLTSEEQRRLQECLHFLESLSRQHHISVAELLSTLRAKDIFMPVSVFTDTLSVLETVVKYLKENHGLTYHAIGELIGRDERNVWHTYHVSQKKHPSRLDIRESSYFLPVSLFRNETYSALETVTRYLKDRFGLSYRDIAKLLKRDQRTIWTVYRRSQEKDGTQ